MAAPAILPNTINITIGAWSAIIATLVAVGAAIATLAGVCVAWGKLTKAMDTIEGTLDKKVLPQLNELLQRVAAMEPIVAIWQNKVSNVNSPRQLNSAGSAILENSGIKVVIDKEKDNLLKIIQLSKPQNAYDADKCVFRVMMDFAEHKPEYMNDLKNWAFKTGTDLQVVLFVGSIYLRDQIFPALGFDLKDLDSLPPTTK